MTGQPAILRGLPTSVFHPIFSELRFGIRERTQPSEDNRTSVDCILQLSCDYYAAEIGRLTKIEPHIGRFLQCEYRETTISANDELLKPSLHRIVNEEMLFCSFIGEVKDECDPIERAVSNYHLLPVNPNVCDRLLSRRKPTDCHDQTAPLRKVPSSLIQSWQSPLLKACRWSRNMA